MAIVVGVDGSGVVGTVVGGSATVVGGAVWAAAAWGGGGLLSRRKSCQALGWLQRTRTVSREPLKG